MKSLAIKTNKYEIVDYLLKKLEKSSFDEAFYYTSKKFRVYNNLIVHYRGKEDASFCNFISNILTEMILDNYEEKIVWTLINTNYFYFEPIEKCEILKNTINLLKMDDVYSSECEYSEYENRRKEKLQFAIYKYLRENKSIVLEGFINFRIQEYMKILDNAVDYSVNKYIVDREYTEFVTLLKLYIASETPKMEFIHLIYNNKQPIIIDKDMNVLEIETKNFSAKYLSDITFSTNDYILNTILNLLPKKICIHLIDEEDEFIETIKLIFDKRVELCKDCSICKTYKMFGPRGHLGSGPK